MYSYQGLKNALVCSSVMSENFKLTSRKFNRSVSVFLIFLFFTVNTQHNNFFLHCMYKEYCDLLYSVDYKTGFYLLGLSLCVQVEHVRKMCVTHVHPSTICIMMESDVGGS
jgi:hypothetical protein